MTLILAATGDDGTYIGADSRHSSDYHYFDEDKPKIVAINDYWAGVSGSTRVSQLVEHTKFRPITEEAHVYEFCKRLKTLLSGEKKLSFTILLATTIGVYVVYHNYQYHRLDRWGIGSGQDYGMGYFDAATGTTPERISAAITSTAQIIPSVGGTPIVRKV